MYDYPARHWLRPPKIGYKVFMIGWRGHRKCPFFRKPKEWKIEKGSVLRAKTVNRKDYCCGAGVNFYDTLDKALALGQSSSPSAHSKKFEVWKVKVLSKVYGGAQGKWRAKSVKLLETVAGGDRLQVWITGTQHGD